MDILYIYNIQALTEVYEHFEICDEMTEFMLFSYRLQDGSIEGLFWIYLCLMIHGHAVV